LRIPNATHREAILLFGVGVIAHIADSVDHAPEPSVDADLGIAPPATTITQTAIRSIKITSATRKSKKPVLLFFVKWLPMAPVPVSVSQSVVAANDFA